MNISELVTQSYELAKEKGWWDDSEFNIAEKLALIHSEVSEALEEIRNNHKPTDIYHNICSTCGGTGEQPVNDYEIREWDCGVCCGIGRKEKPEGFPIELADIIIRVADLCGRLDIDLEGAIAIKHAYNKTRPHRHGGKRF